MNQQAFSIADFCDVFKVGRTIVFHEIATGRLLTYKVGRRRYISTRAATDWQLQREAEAPRPACAASPQIAGLVVTRERVASAAAKQARAAKVPANPPINGSPKARTTKSNGRVKDTRAAANEATGGVESESSRQGGAA